MSRTSVGRAASLDDFWPIGGGSGKGHCGGMSKTVPKAIAVSLRDVRRIIGLTSAYLPTDAPKAMTCGED